MPSLLRVAGEHGQQDGLRIAAAGESFTRLWFKAEQVTMRAELSKLVGFARRVRTGQGYADPLDDLLLLLFEQTDRYIQLSRAGHRLALHVELAQDSGGGMLLHIRGLKGQPLAAEFQDKIAALDLIADALELRSKVRLRRRAGR